MKRPENIINPKDYDKPQSFERDWDGEIYYSYIEAQKYIDYLESEVKKFRLGAVMESDCDHEWINDSFDHFGFLIGQVCDKCGAKQSVP